MKILVKNGKSRTAYIGSSVVVLRDPKKKKEVMELLAVKEYSRAIRYILDCGAEVRQKENSFDSATVDLVLTPDSVHWDLVGEE